MNYVKDSLSPATGGQASQGGAENDPEVREFRSAAAEAVDGAKEAVKPQDSASNQQGSLYEKVGIDAGMTCCGPAMQHRLLRQLRQLVLPVQYGSTVAESCFPAPTYIYSCLCMQASDAAGAVKEKVLPTAQAAGPDEGEKVESAAQQAKDKVVGGANYVAERSVFCD